MKLSELVARLDNVISIQGPLDAEVTGLSWDSRTAQPGDLFVSIVGLKVDGTRFIGGALERGAVAVVTEREYLASAAVAVLQVREARHALSALADAFYGHPTQGLPLVGVTGTNGKTTVAHLVRDLALANGHMPGTIGTAGMLVGTAEVEAKAGFTTPEAPTLHRLIGAMRNQGANIVTMEVSSHALEQSRVAHCHFQVAAFTNLTHEHLDYHGTMENYFQAKASLFTSLAPGSWAVINVDDPYGQRLLGMLPPGVHALTYGEDPSARIRASHVTLEGTGSRFKLNTPYGEAWVSMPYLFGTYNVANALASLGIGLALGYSLPVMVRALSGVKGAPGRFEPINLGQDFLLVVDYAHTPDGFEKLLRDVVKVRKPGGRIIQVFGSAGHRDRTKRPEMGRIAGAFCDMLVLTEEDPRTESALQIMQDLASGVTNRRCEVLMVEDRVEAIEQAVQIARPDDIVLITGKGHEHELEVQHPTTWHGDVEVAQEALHRRLAGEASAARAAGER